MNTLKDKRYTYNKEYCGHDGAMYVVRFCGQWLECFELARHAVIFIHHHKQFRNSSKV